MIPVIASRPDGLGTRLLTILFARQFADFFGATLQINWPSLNDKNYENTANLLQFEQFSEIFDQGNAFSDRLDVKISSDVDLSGKRVMYLHGIMPALADMDLESFVRRCADFDVLFYDLPFSIGYSSYNEAATSVKDLWTKLNFSVDVKNAFATLEKEASLRTAVAIHFRRGDIINMLCQAPLDFLEGEGINQIFQRYLPVGTAAKILKTSYADRTSVIICSEDSNIGDRLTARVPQVRSFSTHHFFDAGSNQHALLDLLALANARHLIAPFKSYFSECASIVGRSQMHNAGLDISALVEELTEELDRVNPKDIAQRKVVVYACAYKNLWYAPDHPLRFELVAKAKAYDADLASRLLE